MTKINFIDLKNTFYSTNSIENDKNITETLTDIEDIDITTTNKNSNKSIEKLYNYILNSLNYQSTTSAFPSSLPDEINIKFTSLNIWEKLNPFNNKSVAKKLINKSITITYFFLKEKPLLYHTDYFFL